MSDLDEMDRTVRALNDEDLERELSFANEGQDPDHPITSDSTPQAQDWLRLLVMERARRAREKA